MKIKLIGTGAAGNKASIELIRQGILEERRIMLVNSTMKDIPEEFKHLAVIFEEGIGGCGKERSLGAELCLNSIKNGKLGPVLDAFVDPDDDLVVIDTSTEGGTGNGSSKILAKYYREVIGIPVLCFGFAGFEDDGRGLQNTVEYFQDMSEDYIVQVISNKKFLEVSTNKLKAEKAANLEFVERIKILIGWGIVDSEQNIDETDLFKVATTPGYMVAGKAPLKIKNVDQFNKALIDMLDENKSLETAKSAKRIAVFLNISEATKDHIDYRFSILRERLGVPYEVFTHIQNNEEEPEYISFIASGMKMPLDEVKEVYQRYNEESMKVDKQQDSFFAFASGLKGNADDNAFNVGRRNNINPNIEERKNSFFGNFDKKQEVVEQPVSVAKRDPKISKDQMSNF